MNWEPIETVPIGKRVLLHWPDYPHIECGTAFDDSYDGRLYFVLFDGDSMSDKPKEWMPLPGEEET